MTISAQDLYSTLGPRVGYPPIRAQDIDRVVRVLNQHCDSAVTVGNSRDLAVPSTGQAAAAHAPLLPNAEHSGAQSRVADEPATGGTPTWAQWRALQSGTWSVNSRIEDILRVTPTHVTNRHSGAPSPVLAALLVTERDIINELRRPGRPQHLPGSASDTNGRWTTVFPSPPGATMHPPETATHASNREYVVPQTTATTIPPLDLVVMVSWAGVTTSATSLTDGASQPFLRRLGR